MLNQLRLRNFVLADRVQIDFADGLTALTGETGAGKSVVAGALALIMGDAVRGDVLLDPARPAVIEAVFGLNDANPAIAELCARHEIDTADGELFFSKEIPPQGAARSFLNGRRVTGAIVRDFRDALIDFTSQREQMLLFSRGEQLLYLDTFGDLLPQREQYHGLYTRLLYLRRQLNDLRRAAADQRARRELLQYQAEELDALALSPGEDEELESEFNRLSHAEEILTLAAEAEQELYESDFAAVSRLRRHVNALHPFATDCRACGEAHQALTEALVALDEAVSGLRRVPDEVAVDRERLDAVQQRLDTLNRIKQKYRRNLPQLLEYRQTIGEELAGAAAQDGRIGQLAAEADEVLRGLAQSAAALSAARRQAAGAFCAALDDNLHQLAMPQARCAVRFDAVESPEIVDGGSAYGAQGAEEVELLIATHPTAAPQSLKNVASGGELSRILLSIKQMLTGREHARTIIFDEIDAGIGGRTADVLGEFIARIAKTHQVLCITHLPQVAAYAKNQYAIQKTVDEVETRIKVNRLTNTQRKEEIARMLAGSDSALALQHAEEILAKGALEKYD